MTHRKFKNAAKTYRLSLKQLAHQINLGELVVAEDIEAAAKAWLKGKGKEPNLLRSTVMRAGKLYGEMQDEEVAIRRQLVKEGEVSAEDLEEAVCLRQIRGIAVRLMAKESPCTRKWNELSKEIVDLEERLYKLGVSP